MANPQETPDLCVYRTELLIRFLASFKFITPTTLGIFFFFAVSLPLTVWATLEGQPLPGNADDYVSYLKNISWSVSLLYLFPFVVGLTLKFYQEIPKLFSYLYDSVVESGAENDVNEFKHWLDKRFNGRVHPFAMIALTLGLNWLYFVQILDRHIPNWMTGGELLKDFFNTNHGLTSAGLVAAIIQIILIYWVFMLVWKTVIFSWGLHEFFNRRFGIKIDLLHPDGNCGLKPLNDTVMYLNYILLLLGMYVSLKVVDKIVIQNLPLFADIGNPLMLGSYAILAPLLFFFPLGAPHYKMREEKQKFILELSRKSREFYSKLTRAADEKSCSEANRTFHDLEQTRTYLIESIPVWPFNIRSIETFTGIVIVPLLPTVISLAFDFFT